jgi:predicted GIY-YIG superfamily endonuclease
VKPVVYVLSCADGTLYTGTVALNGPLREDNAAKASKYTRGQLPVELVGSFEVGGSARSASARGTIQNAFA